MQRSWFNNRLTSAKQKSLLYKSLADLVQSMMDTFVDPWLERITNRKSIFSMSKEDLETRTNELGQFFTIRTSNSSSVPMLLQQRFDEIHFKGTERPINQTIYREFNGISVLWDPIYAPVDFERPDSRKHTGNHRRHIRRDVSDFQRNDQYSHKRPGPDNGYYWNDRSVRNYRRNSQKV